MKRICNTCGLPENTKTITKGSFLIELLLWCMLIAPGLIYSLWRLSTRYSACRHCGSSVFVPENSPAGRNTKG